jgi:hypothetical protein
MTRHSLLALSVVSLVTFGSIVGAAANAPVSYSARLVNFEEPMGRSSGLMQLRVTRWSTDADREDITASLLKGGQQGLLEAVSKLPEAGVIRTPGTAGYPFRYARRIQAANGDETILLIIDRPIGFAEFRQGWQTRDYPFTVIELTLNDRGTGEGRLLPATRIEADPATGDISFEQYSATAMLLQNVREE